MADHEGRGWPGQAGHDGESAGYSLTNNPTRTRYSPSGGATGPQAARLAGGECCSEIIGAPAPSPTHTSEPTIERTWLCRNERAEVTMWIASPWRVTSSWSSVLSGDFAWHSVSRKRREICACRSAVARPDASPPHRDGAAPARPADVEREIGRGC